MMSYLSRDNFRHRLTLTLTTGMLGLALLTSLSTSWIITRRLHDLMIEYGIHISGQFSAESIFAFLVEDPAVGRRTIANIKAFPGVRYAAILTPDHVPLIAEGTAVSWSPAYDSSARGITPVLAGEDDQYLHFIAPVRTRSLTLPYEDNPTPSELLGYIHIAWDRTLLINLKLFIFAVNGGFALIFAVALIFWLRFRVRHLTRPLSDLVGVMQQAQRDDEGVRAAVTGPEEVRTIGRVFNALMAQLEQQKASLESEVAIRTLELREARDAALTAARHKSEFMAAITHEMRTPLHSIAGYTQLVLEEVQFLEKPKDCSNWLKTVLNSANDLLFRINQILDLARVEAGKMEVCFDWIDLRQLVERTSETINPLLQNNQNTLQVTICGHHRLISDPDKLSQILLNLLTNACKFTQQGTITLTVQNNDDHELFIQVADTGIGIPPSQQEEIFEPFRQADMSDTRRYQGTGLGLAITQRFCELLEGTIAVDSQVDKGSTFTLSIPLPTQAVVSDSQVSSEPHTAAAVSTIPVAP